MGLILVLPPLEAERGRLLTIEGARRAEISAEEERLRRERAQWDDREKEERLRQIGAVESAYRASLQKQRAQVRLALNPEP